MRIALSEFKGMRPKISAHLIDKSMAQVASNCQLVKGELRPFKAPAKDEAISLTTVQSLFKYEENGNENWFVSANALDFCKSPISDDTYERVYFTGESEPRFFANDNVSSPFDGSADYYKLGIPAPTTAPTVVSTGGGATYKGYVYAYVNSYGDEGPPSPVGSDDDYDTGTVAIEDIVAAPADRAIDKIYLYRTNASGDGTAEFQFVLEATWFSASVSYVVGDFVIYGTDLYKCTVNHSAAAWDAGHFTAGDDVADASLLSVFPKTNYDQPPDGLKALVSLPNGTFAGIYGKALYFSEPFHPHAYPTEYIIGFDETPIGLGVIGSTVIVLTTGFPYEIYGQHPSAMSKAKSAFYFPCTSKRGIVSAAGAVFWPTNEGIARASAGGYDIATGNIMDADDWADFTPTTVAGCFFQGKYFGFDQVTSTGFILDFVNNLFVSISVYSHASYVEDKLYMVCDDTSVVDETSPPANMPLCVSEWEGATTNYLLYTWRSKEFILNQNTNFSTGLIALDDNFYDAVVDLLDLETDNSVIFAEDYIDGSLGETSLGLQEIGGDSLYDISDHNINSDIGLKIYADDRLKVNKTISGAIDEDVNVLLFVFAFGDTFSHSTIDGAIQLFTLPAGYTSRRLFIELSGYVPVKHFVIATSPEELGG